MKKSSRLSIGIVAAAALLAGALVTPLTAEAAPKRIVCKENECHQSCTQQLPNGDTVYYDHGTRITILTADGETHEFVCKEGKWERARTFEWTGPLTVGNIGVAAIAGVKGEVTGTVCDHDVLRPICSDVSYPVGPPGRVATIQ